MQWFWRVGKQIYQTKRIVFFTVTLVSAGTLVIVASAIADELIEPRWPNPNFTPGMEWTAPDRYGPPPDEPWLSTARCYGLANRVVHDKSGIPNSFEALSAIYRWLNIANKDYEKMVRARVAAGLALPAGPSEIVAAVDAGYVYADTKLWGGKSALFLSGILDHCAKNRKI